MSQLIPGKQITIESRCVQSGEPIRIRMRDSDVLEVTPETAVAHANVPLAQWGDPSWAFT